MNEGIADVQKYAKIFNLPTDHRDKLRCERAKLAWLRTEVGRWWWWFGTNDEEDGGGGGRAPVVLDAVRSLVVVTTAYLLVPSHRSDEALA